MKWKRPVANRMLSERRKRPENSCFTIVRRKVRPVAEAFVFDKEGWESRKEARPENTAMEMAVEMGIEILDEEQYRALQKLGAFDAKTSSWLKTPPGIRKLGGAIFGDFRYGTVFIYHNGAQSYYAARGFRGLLKV